ncbi:MAG TPA: phosphoglycerate dehydrogenase [Polyangia bacterium]|nr:phosphoglycerate dehydrogenase [Polyangia bacterium]
MKRYRVLIADELSPRAVEILSQHPDVDVEMKTGLKGAALTEALRGVHGLAVRSATKVTAEVLEAAGDLKIVGRAGIGVDNIDVPAASRRGVIVMNTPSGNAITTAEHALFLLCSLARHIPQATASMKAGKWDKKKFQGSELFDKTLGIVGLGNIGRIVADRALGLKMKVVGYDPFLTTEAAQRIGVELLPLDEIWKRADMITIHTPLNAETRGLVGAAAFAKMKDGVLIVNAARGGIVDEAALLAALDAGKVGGAALDVFAEEPPPAGHPLVAHERVICTPHLGASTDEAQEKVAVEVAEQLLAYLTRGEVKNAVNVPAVAAEHQPRIQPYLELAGKLGALIGQLTAGVTGVDVEMVGDVAELGGKLIPGEALAGFLRQHLDVPVNAVNAKLLAGDRGLAISETVRSRGSNFTSSITLRAHGPQGERSVKGVVFSTDAGYEPRIVRIDRFYLEVVPDGRVLVLRNEDRPGVIGAVGTLLGGRGINVSRMQVGLDKARAQALQLWSVDGNVEAATLEAIRRVAGVVSAQVVTL